MDKIVKYEKLIIIFFLLFIFISVSLIIHFQNITPDELYQVGAGITMLENHDWSFRTGRSAPPLSFYISSIPLFFYEFNESTWSLDNQARRGIDIIYSEKGGQILYWIKFPFILISLLLAIYVYKWAKELYGIKAGFLALLLYSFNPMILAFSSISNQDILATCFTFIAFYYFWRYVKNPTRSNLIIAAIAFGLAQLSKFTALILIPLFVLIGLFIVYKKKIKFSKMFFSLFIIFLLGFLMVWSFYGFETKTLSKTIPESRYDRVYDRLNEVLPENNIIKNGAFYLIENIPVPLPSYLYNVGVLHEFMSHGFSSFFMGEYYIKGIPSFYIIGFLIKSPIPLLILILLSTVFFKRIKSRDLMGELFLITFVSAYLIYWSFIGNLSAVFRHMLPIFPFIFVFVSKVVNLNFKKLILKHSFKIFMVLLIIWYVLSSILIFPYYLTYFNEFIGGPNNGYKYMVDSNLDWGQDLKGLKVYMTKNNIENIKLSYFGAGSVEYYNISYTYLLSHSDFLKPPKGYIETCGYTEGLLAVSATNLQGLYLENRSCYDWLKEYEPIDKIGYSIFIYNISK